MSCTQLAYGGRRGLFREAFKILMNMTADAEDSAEAGDGHIERTSDRFICRNVSQTRACGTGVGRQQQNKAD